MEQESEDILVVRHEQDQTRNTMKELPVDICFCSCSLPKRCLVIGCLKYIVMALKIIGIIFELFPSRPYSAVGYASVLTVLVVLDGLMTIFLRIGMLKEKKNYFRYIVVWCLFRSFWELVDTIIAMTQTGLFLTNLVSLFDIIITLYLALVVESYRRVLLNKEGLPPYNQQQNESPPKYEA